MAGFLEALSDGIQSRWCALSTEDIVLGGLIAAGTTGAAPILAITGAVAVARKSSDQICNRATASPPPLPPDAPFSGGQCEGTPYRVQFFGTVNPNGDSFNPIFFQSTNGTIVGKISAAFAESPTTAPSGVKFIVVANGVRYEEFGLSSANTWNFDRIEITPLFGGEDTCGDPPSTYEPIPEYDDTVDIPFEDDDGNPVNFPDLPIKWFPPCIGIDGLKIPFEIETPLGRICGKVEVKPDIKTGVKPKVDFDLCPSEKETLKEIQPEKIEEYFEVSAPIGAITEEFPESHYGGVPSFQAEPEKPILGVFIKAGSDGSDDGRGTEIYQTSQSSNSPILVVPRMGSVRFYCLISKEEGNTHDWSLPIDIKQAKQFIPCPWSFGALAVDIQWERGYSGVYSIAKRKSCCESCSEIDPKRLPENVDRCD